MSAILRVGMENDTGAGFAEMVRDAERLEQAGHSLAGVFEDFNQELDARRAAAYRTEIKRMVDEWQGIKPPTFMDQVQAELETRKLTKLREEIVKTADAMQGLNVGKIREEGLKAADGMSRAFNSSLQLAKGLALLGISSEQDLAKLSAGIAQIEGLAVGGRAAVDVVNGMCDAYKAVRAAAAAQAAMNAALASSNVAVATTGTAAAGSMTALGAAMLMHPATQILLGIGAAAGVAYAAFKFFEEELPTHIKTATERLREHHRTLISLPDAMQRYEESCQAAMSAALTLHNFQIKADEQRQIESFKEVAGLQDVIDAETRQQAAHERTAREQEKIADQVRQAAAEREVQLEKANMLEEEARQPWLSDDQEKLTQAIKLRGTAAETAARILYLERQLAAAEAESSKESAELNVLMEHRLSIERRVREERRALAREAEGERVKAIASLDQARAELSEQLRVKQELLTAGKVETLEYGRTAEAVSNLKAQLATLRQESIQRDTEALRRADESARGQMGLSRQIGDQRIAMLGLTREQELRHLQELRDVKLISAEREQAEVTRLRGTLRQQHQIRLQQMDRETEQEQIAHEERLKQIQKEKATATNAAEKRTADLKEQHELERGAHDEKLSQLKRVRETEQQAHELAMEEKRRELAIEDEKFRKKLEHDKKIQEFLIGTGGADPFAMPMSASGLPGSGFGALSESQSPAMGVGQFVPPQRPQLTGHPVIDFKNAIPAKEVLEEIIQQRTEAAVQAMGGDANTFDLKIARWQKSELLKQQGAERKQLRERTDLQPDDRKKAERELDRGHLAQQREKDAQIKSLGASPQDRRRIEAQKRSEVNRAARTGPRRDITAERADAEQMRKRQQEERRAVRGQGMKASFNLAKQQARERAMLRAKRRSGGYRQGGIDPNEVNDAKRKITDQAIQTANGLGVLSDEIAEQVRSSNAAHKAAQETLIKQAAEVRSLREALESMTSMFNQVIRNQRGQDQRAGQGGI